MARSDEENEKEPSARELAQQYEVEIDEDNRRDLAKGSYVDISWDLMRGKVSKDEIKGADQSGELMDHKLAKETTQIYRQEFQQVNYGSFKSDNRVLCPLPKKVSFARN